MKFPFLITLFLTVNAYSQVNFDEVDTVNIYNAQQIDSSHLKVYLFPCDFNNEQIFNQVPDELKDVTVEQIDLVYSTYKSVPSFDQEALNNNRINELFNKFEPAQNELIYWRSIGQSNGDSRDVAQELFHGFAIYYRPNPTTETMEAEIAELDAIFESLLTQSLTESLEASSISAAPIVEVSETKDENFVEEIFIGARSKESRDVGGYNSFSYGKLANGKCRIYNTQNFVKSRVECWNFVDSLKNVSENKNVKVTSPLFHLRIKSVTWQVDKDRCPDEIELSDSSVTDGFIKSSDPMVRPELGTYYKKTGFNIVESVFERYPNWHNTLVVMDVTGSMSPYIASTMAWTMEVQDSNFVEAFVFFNDGDRKKTKNKVIGEVEGIYGVENTSFKEVYTCMRETMRRGGGGDCPENNVEAVIKGLYQFPDCNEVVLVADNYATPRDLALVKDIGKPVHVILCGANSKINTAYIQLAFDTGGSIHTIEEDIDLKEIKVDQKFEVDGKKYRIKNNRVVRAN